MVSGNDHFPSSIFYQANDDLRVIFDVSAQTCDAKARQNRNNSISLSLCLYYAHNDIYSYKYVSNTGWLKLFYNVNMVCLVSILLVQNNIT